MFRSRDMTQASFQDQQGTKKRKRNRETLSCMECRSRKIACDRGRPCFNCVRFKRSDACTYSSDTAAQNGANAVQAEEPASNHISPAWSASSNSKRDPVEDRIARIEQQLTNMASSRGNSVSHASPQPWRKTSNANTPVSDSPHGDNIFARGRLSSKPTRRPYYIGPTAWTITGPMDVFSENQDNFREILMPQWKRFGVLCANFPAEPHDTILNLLPVTPPPDVFAELQRTIPSDANCRALVRRYLDGPNEVYPIVVREQFEEELDKFFADRWNASPYWLGLLAAILAIGYMVPIHPLADGSWTLKPSSTRTFTTLAQQQAFVASASAHRSPLITFQTLLALVICKHVIFGWSDANSPMSGLLGLANRLVFPLGLHHDPSTSRLPVSAEETELRRRLFVTYLQLEMDHCLRAGVPLMMRSRDFDTEEPSPQNNMHQVFFFRKFELLSSVMELTHSNRVKPSISHVAEHLRELGSAAETLKSALHIDPRSASSIFDTVRFSLLAVLFHRLHEAMLVPILDHCPPALRSQYTNDLVGPANDAMDVITSLITSVENLAPPEAVYGWKIFILSQLKTSMYGIAAFQLVFLQRSLSDPTLNALRGKSPDSAQQFRKIRGLLRLTALSASLSRIGVKEQCGFISYLKTVEERYRIFVETGQAEIDLTKDEGRPLLFAVSHVMQRELDELEEAIKENVKLHGEGSSSAEVEIAKQDQVSVPTTDWSGSMDQSLLDGFDWPWTDLMFEQNWSMPLQAI